MKRSMHPYRNFILMIAVSATLMFGLMYLNTYQLKPTNLRAMAGHHPDGDMAWKIENGKDAMPAWKDIFTKQQIWNLVNFIQSLKKRN